MNFLYAIIYGIIEGITEWLPISSTGHLILANTFLKFAGEVGTEEFWNMFEVVIQFGAILAVVVLYIKNIWPLKFKEKDGSKKLGWDKDTLNLWGKILVSCVPAAIVGLAFDDLLDKYLYNPLTIGIMLILVGIVFIIIETRHKKKYRVEDIKELTYKDALIIGAFQLIAAIFPGTSRSGATIVGALMIGISRVVAAEYTFYLAIPVMAGASLLKLIKMGAMTGYQLGILAIGCVVTFIVSMFIIKFLMNFIKKHDFKPFAYYRILLGIVVLVLLFTHLI
jgi:undecaprenyl-diphosphatase